VLLTTRLQLLVYSKLKKIHCSVTKQWLGLWRQRHKNPQRDNQDWLALLGVPRAKAEAKCLLQRRLRSVCPIGRRLQLRLI